MARSALPQEKGEQGNHGDEQHQVGDCEDEDKLKPCTFAVEGFRDVNIEVYLLGLAFGT